MDYTRDCPEQEGRSVRLLQCQICKNVKCPHSQALKTLAPTDWFGLLTDEERSQMVDMLQAAYERYRAKLGCAHL